MTMITGATGSMWTADARKPDSDDPVVILIHSAGGFHLQWPRSLRRIDGAQVVAPDLPGHGRSPAPGRDTISAYAADIVALMDALHISRAVMVGHSMGAAVALWLGLAHRERVSGLVLMGAGAKMAVHPALLEDLRAAPERGARTIVEWVWSEAVTAEMREQYYQQLLEMPPGVLYGDFVACNGFDIRERLGEINVPALVIGARADRMTPQRHSEFLCAHLPDAQMVLVDGGHMMHLEQSEAVGEAAEAWIKANFR